MLESDNQNNMHKQECNKNYWMGFVAGILVTVVLSCAAMLIVIGVTKNNSFVKTARKSQDTESITDQSVINKMSIVENIVRKNYWQDIDEETLEQGVYRGILDSLEDPYSVYYTAEELEKLREETQGIYYGIGAYISQNTDIGYAQISKVIKNTPAEESGLMQDDIIYKVNDEDMQGKDSNYVVSRIKGDEHTFVKITVIRENEKDPIDFDVERRKIETPTVEYTMYEDNMAYIQISEFDIVTTSQFENAYEQAKKDGMKGLIIDLRSNPGGNLSTVCEIARMILPKGLIVYTEDKYGKREEYTCDGSHQIDVPLVVLTNGHSASASEILAGAIKDYKIGKLVGTTTFGKGIVQSVLSLSDGSAVKLTVSSYFTPNGNNIHEIGIEPDVEVEFDSEQYKNGVDNQLERGKEVLAGMMK
ncbi:MAG: S41 family peptidase [Lachnospiraceae bacterium]|nr:S41 family peptidase [Lachnospiraceae bacterium]